MHGVCTTCAQAVHRVAHNSAAEVFRGGIFWIDNPIVMGMLRQCIRRKFVGLTSARRGSAA